MLQIASFFVLLSGVCYDISSMTDLAHVIEKAKQGDTKAFQEIYKEYYKKIFRYCIFNGQHEESAKDICQEVFLRAWKSLPSFSLKNGGTIQAFLFRIARNLMIDLSRKKKVYALQEYEHIETNEDFIEDFAREQSIKNVKTALLELEEKDQQIVILRYFEELSTSDVAKALNMKEGALRVRIHRTLKKLEDILQKHEN